MPNQANGRWDPASGTARPLNEIRAEAQDALSVAKKVIANKRKKMGPYVFACQILQDPKADEVQGFDKEWIRYWGRSHWSELNRYLLCDPAGEKKKVNDYTVMLVIGLGSDENYYLIDGIRDRLNLQERTKKLFELHKRYKPIATGYEKYGKDSDIEHVEYVQEQINYRFKVHALGGPTPKNDRIRKLIPLFSEGRFYMPNSLLFMGRDGKAHDLIAELIDEEYDAFPVGAHDDILDCAARIVDEKLGASFPMKNVFIPDPSTTYEPHDAHIGL